MVVLEKSYLVGQIIEVNYTTSRAILISDLNSNIPVVIEPGSFQSILSGTGKDYGIIKYSKKNSPGNRKINTLVPQRLVCFKCHVARDRIIYDIKQLVADNCVTGHSLSIAETFKS